MKITNLKRLDFKLVKNKSLLQHLNMSKAGKMSKQKLKTKTQ